MKRMIEKNGFTLIEVVISLAILAIILVSFSNVFVSGFTSVIMMGHRTKAVEQSQNTMDIIQVREKTEEDFIYGLKTSEDFKNTFISSINSSIPSGLSVADVKVDIASLTAPSAINQSAFDRVNARMYSMTVTVLYENGRKSVSLTSLIPQGGE